VAPKTKTKPISTNQLKNVKTTPIAPYSLLSEISADEK
jgi:hypothetical protein